MLGPSRAIMRGVKPLLTSRRMRTCRGGSIVISETFDPLVSGGAFGSVAIAMPRDEMKVAGSREIARTSACLVIDQKPGNQDAPGCHDTGASARIRRQTGCALFRT